MSDEYLAGFGAKESDLCLKQLYLFARSAPPHLQQSINDRIKVYIILIGHGLLDVKFFLEKPKYKNAGACPVSVERKGKGGEVLVITRLSLRG